MVRIRKKVMKAAREVEKATRPSEPEEEKTGEVAREDVLSSGSTLLNLACTNNPFGAFLKGKYYFLVGDSTSGKTFLAMTCFAEALLHPTFRRYRLIYDNVEDGCLIDLAALFNKKVARKVHPPAIDDDGGPIYSFTVEEFYYHLDDAVARAREDGRPFVYVLDSMDGLSSSAEIGKFEEHKKAHRKGAQTAGSYGDGKAKKNSEGLRKVLKGLRDTGSILIIISQTRDNIGFGFEKKTRSGGHALRFYATVEIWSSLAGAIKKRVKGKERKVGIDVALKIKKNRVTGELHEVRSAIYPSYGIDDIGTCVDFLVQEGRWEQKRGSSLVRAKDLGVEMQRTKLIRHIEDNQLYQELQNIVGACWNDVRDACALDRPRRYQ